MIYLLSQVVKMMFSSHLKPGSSRLSSQLYTHEIVSDCNRFLQVADLKKLIDTTQGQNVYPADQQMLIHQGNVLKNDTTLEESKVLENNFIVIMLSKVPQVLPILVVESSL
jgi:hypothetical protein